MGDCKCAPLLDSMRDEIERLTAERAAALTRAEAAEKRIAEAPHGPGCATLWKRSGGLDIDIRRCTCWKKEATDD